MCEPSGSAQVLNPSCLVPAECAGRPEPEELKRMTLRLLVGNLQHTRSNINRLHQFFQVPHLADLETLGLLDKFPSDSPLA
jgi:hypothetical protein